MKINSYLLIIFLIVLQLIGDVKSWFSLTGFWPARSNASWLDLISRKLKVGPNAVTQQNIPVLQEEEVVPQWEDGFEEQIKTVKQRIEDVTQRLNIKPTIHRSFTFNRKLEMLPQALQQRGRDWTYEVRKSKDVDLKFLQREMTITKRFDSFDMKNKWKRSVVSQFMSQSVTKPKEKRNLKLASYESSPSIHFNQSSKSTKKFIVPFPSVNMIQNQVYITFPGSKLMRLPIHAQNMPHQLKEYYLKASQVLNQCGCSEPKLKDFKRSYHSWIFRKVLPALSVHDDGFQDLTRVVRDIEDDFEGEIENLFLDWDEKFQEATREPEQVKTSPPPWEFSPRILKVSQPQNGETWRLQIAIYVLSGASLLLLFIYLFLCYSGLRRDQKMYRTLARDNANSGACSPNSSKRNWEGDIEVMRSSELISLQKSHSLQTALKTEARGKIQQVKLKESLTKIDDVMPAHCRSSYDLSDSSDYSYFWKTVKKIMENEKISNERSKE